jgi:iron-sulfur cluster insertion protein
MVRHVLHLPEQTDEYAMKVELIAGRTVETDGVTLLVDPASLQYLAGAEIDYQDGLEGSRFVIRNPNASSSCSCGSSFSVDGGATCSTAQ